jgi:hypothetical protein
LVISGFIVTALVIAVVWSMPDSAVKQIVTPALAPVAATSGLEQSWKMFSPNPPRRLSDVVVIVAMSNGEKRVWQFEPDRSVVNSFHWDRWRKMKEQLMNEKSIRRDFASWVVRQLTKPNERPVRVSIVQFSQTLPAPGTDGPIKKEAALLYDRKFQGAK